MQTLKTGLVLGLFFFGLTLPIIRPLLITLAILVIAVNVIQLSGMIVSLLADASLRLTNKVLNSIFIK